jgi:hypothetical protein
VLQDEKADAQEGVKKEHAQEEKLYSWHGQDLFGRGGSRTGENAVSQVAGESSPSLYSVVEGNDNSPEPVHSSLFLTEGASLLGMERIFQSSSKLSKEETRKERIINP